jgi:hypothetical protein
MAGMFTKVGFDETIQRDHGAEKQLGSFQLFPSEIALSLALVLLFALSLGLPALYAQAVNWPAFAPAIVAFVCMMVIGAYARGAKRSPRFALAMIGVGIFMAFTCTIAIVAYTFFPFSNPRIDLALMAIDAQIGFNWVRFVEWIASVPGLGRFLRHVYVSSLYQMVLTVLLLAFLNRPRQMHRFLVTGVMTMCVTIAFWRAWPSIGPPAYVSIPADIETKAALIADRGVGDMLLRFATEGNAVITPEIVTGIVSFPSYHLMMACVVVWFTRRTILFIPALTINLAMIPATLLHGGHHLIDLPAGIMTFAACLWLTYKLVPEPRPD